jgi:hypothetical protein
MRLEGDIGVARLGLVGSFPEGKQNSEEVGPDLMLPEKLAR